MTEGETEEAEPGPGGLERLERLGRWVAARPWRVLAGAAVLVAAALAAASGLRLEPDLLSVVSRDDPAVEAFLTTTERFGSLDRLMVVLELPPEDGPDGAAISREPYFELADRVAAGLEALPEVERVEHRLPDLAALARELTPYAFLLVPPERADELAERLSPEGLAAAARATRQRLSTPGAQMERGRLRADPFDLASLVAGRFDLGQATGGLADPVSGYFVSPDGRLLLLDVRAARPAHDVPFARRLVAETRRVLDRAVAATRDGLPAGLAAHFTPRPALAGGYALAAMDVDRVERDLAVNTGFALAAVGLLFFLAFRRLVASVLVVLPLLAGLALAGGLAALTVGRLSSLTASVAALLVGLGVDFTIVLLERYGEERRRGRPPEAAAGIMLGSTGRGVAVGAATTAATFFAFLLSDFQGLFELGWLTGAGILLCLAATFLLLPALLSLVERWHQRRQDQRRQERRPRPPTPLPLALRMRSFGSPRLVAFCRRHPRATVLAWVVVLAVLSLGLPRLTFDDNLGAMRAADHQVVRTQRAVTEAFGLSTSRMVLRLDAPAVGNSAPEELLSDARRLRQRLQPLLDDGTLSHVVSLPDLVPPLEDQRAMLAALEVGRYPDPRPAGPFDPSRVLPDARQALGDAGLAPAAFEDALQGLESALNPPGPIDISALRRGPLGPWLDQLLAEDAGEWSTALYLVPASDRWRSRPPPRLEEIAAEEGAALVGLNTLSEAMRRQTWQDLEVVAPVALAAVWLLLIADFRSIRAGSQALLPVIPGLLVLLGLAGLLGIPLSLMNLFVVVLVLGIGVDYGVHMVHRHREALAAGADAAAINAALGETSKAVLLASLTTAVGFGSLALSGFAGLRSVGWLSVFGALGAGLAGVTLLPSLQRAGKR